MEKYKKYQNNGITGLNNIGNTCFINSCFQILSHTYELNEILNGVEKRHTNKNINNTIDAMLLTEWNDLRKMMWNENCTITPTRFVEIIRFIAEKKNLEFSVKNSQHDISEFFVFVIGCFHNALKKNVGITINGTPETDIDKVVYECYKLLKTIYEKEYSEIWNLFYGISVSLICDNETGKLISSVPEEHSILSLSIPTTQTPTTLYDCLDLYFQEETIENYVNTTENKNQTIKRKSYMWKLPPVLVIELKRYDNMSFFITKNKKMVEFPLTGLDLTKYVLKYHEGYGEDQLEEQIYDLYGVFYHYSLGKGTSFGHYIACVKNSNSNWYSFDDCNVSIVKNKNQLINNDAYCFFYRKRNLRK